MNIHHDFEEFLQLLNAEEVEYLVVGGYAIAFFGYPRATNDMDIFFNDSEENITRLAQALERFGLKISDEQKQQFFDPGSRIQLGIQPVCLELINRISGVKFQKAWSNRTSGRYGEISIHYISLEDLIINKKSSGRPKDLADIDELGF